MPLSQYRNPIRPARGTKAALLSAANQSQFKTWELLHATDEDALYVWNGTELINVGTTAQALAAKADLDANGHLVFDQLPPITLNNLSDVITVQAVDGSVLTYRASTGTFVADDLDTKLSMVDGANF